MVERTTAGLMPLELFFFFFTPPSGRGLVIPIFFIIFLFFLVTCHRLPVFCRPDKYSPCTFSTRARNCILSDLNMFYTPRGGRTTAGSNGPGAFLVFHFFGGHLPQTSGFRSAKEILVVSFATQARACILSDRNICTPQGEGQQRKDLMPLGLFLLVI